MTEEAAPRYKVGRVLDRYGIPDVGDELVRRWRGDGVDRQSLRDLAAYTNERLVAAAMAEAGGDPLDGEAANVHRLLVDDDVSEGVRTQARRRLERRGVDVDRLESDFVSYQAVRTYLKEGRDVEAPGAGGDPDPAPDPVDSAADQLTRLMDRTTAVARERIDRLLAAGEVEAGDPQVLLDLRVFCEECGRQYDVVEFLDAGGCDCADDPP